MSVAVPVTQFGGGSCYRHTSVAAVPITLLLQRHVASGTSFHRQVSGGPCYTDRSVGIPVIQTGQRRFLLHFCYTDRSETVPIIQTSQRRFVTQTCQWRFLSYRQIGGGSC